MRPAEQIAAEIEAMHGALGNALNPIGDELLREAAAALRARPGREEARAILMKLATQAYPTDDEAECVEAALIKLGYGPEEGR